MGIFNFLRSKRSDHRPPIINTIGTFLFTDLDGEKRYIGKINSKFKEGIELIFPVDNREISIYQTEYFKKIESNWQSILSQLMEKYSEMKFEDYGVETVMIPDKDNEWYDVDGEIVFHKNDQIVSVILSGLNVDDIIINTYYSAKS